jgi:hypothetical protein
MNEQQLAAVKLALDALKKGTGWMEHGETITALRSIISQDALDKMAEESRTSGLRLDDWDKIGCVNHDCDKCKAREKDNFCDKNCVWTDHHPDCKAVQEPWVDLTNEEIMAAPENLITCIAYVRNKLREKNAAPPPAAQPAPVQEPVAWMQEDGEHFSIWKDKYATVPLYTTPPAPQPVPVKTYHDGKPWPVAPKTWVNLTDEDKAQCIQATIESGSVDELIRAIEAKLKEKNT